MHRLHVVLFTCLAAVPVTVAGQQALPQRFTIDASHSAATFEVRFMGLSSVRGAFSDLSGTIMYVDGKPEASSVSVVIGTESINSNSKSRDTHLRTPDFFDVKTYPWITFRSEQVRSTRKGFVITGPLTIHGVTKTVDIPVVQLNAPVGDAWGNRRATFHGSIAISRKEYGVLGTAFWNGEFDPGRMAVSDKVDIDLLISATIANPERWRQPFGDSLLAQIESRGMDPVITELKAHAPSADSVPDFAFTVAAEKLVARQRIADAIRLYATAVSLRPASMVLHQQLGEAYVKGGQLDRAREEFEQVIAAEPLATTSSEWLRILKRSAR